VKRFSLEGISKPLLHRKRGQAPLPEGVFGPENALGQRSQSPFAAVLKCALTTLFIAVALATGGCRPAQQSEDEPAAAETGGQWGERYLAYAVDNLQRLEQFSGGEMRQPVVDRLNQWVEHEKPPADWKLDPLVAGLAKPLAGLPEMNGLDAMLFTPYDGYALQEAIWLRDLSNWARGSQLEDLVRAENLFDWVVRNIQLVPGTGRGAEEIPQQPWETLLWGKGRAVDRAWVFVLLLRQQRIDAVVLALPDAGDAKGERLEPWAVGVLVEKDLYLFDPALGLPIPGPAGVKYENKRLVIPPATLAEVVKEPALLRKLDVEGRAYPVDAERLAKVAALVEASPYCLAARMHLLESRLVGDQQVVLTHRPSETVERLGKVAHLAGSRLWTWPYEVLARRAKLTEAQWEQLRLAMLPFEVTRGTPLRKGRVMHLKGVFTGAGSATAYYQEARPSARIIVALKRRIAEETDPKTAATERERLEAQLRGRGDATYWLGLVAVAENQEDRLKVAADYFNLQPLVKAWTDGAAYNLGRIAESLGNAKEAAVIYRTSPASPDTAGKLLRAKWLDPGGQNVALPGAEK
jgi:hypothetical protein